MDSPDYVIVGAGSAGCVLANRLSADPGINVVLLEAGGTDRSPLFSMPKGFGRLMSDEKAAWQYPTRPFGPSQQHEVWPRGKVLGGSSSINGMVYNRGSHLDYDALEQAGNPSWGWETILPIFKSFEDNALGPSPTRGAGGPLHVSPPRDPDLLCEEMVAAGGALGLTPMADVNESDDERIGHTMATIRAGRRVSAAAAFLHPVRTRPNLRVLTRVVVTELVFEGDAVVGVRGQDHQGATIEVRVNREVLLSLGSLNTPKLLQRSGIGPREVLARAGIEVRLDRPNVGARMREHRCFAIKFRLNENLGYNRLLAGTARQSLTALRYMATRKGPLAAPAYDVIGFLKSRPDIARPDAQLLLGPFSAGLYKPGQALGVERLPGISAVAFVLRPTSEGTVAITSAEPDAPLDIDVNYLGSEHDRRVGVDLFRRLRQLFAQKPLADRISHETLPGPEVESDEDIIGAALDAGYCGYHAIGTCAMGPNDEYIVDPQLRVRGVRNLRVIDCSVIPTMVSGNLNGPMMALASHAADLVLGGDIAHSDARRDPSPSSG